MSDAAVAVAAGPSPVARPQLDHKAPLAGAILFIGLLGFVLDWLARLAHRRWSAN